MKRLGWTIRYFPEGSCHWQALRHGVRLRANSKEDLLRMIVTRDYTPNTAISAAGADHGAAGTKGGVQ